MRVSRQPSQLELHSRRMRRTAEQLRKAIGVNHKTWCDILHLTQPEYIRILNGTDELPAHSLHYVAEWLQLSVEAVIYGRIDHDAVTRHYAGEMDYVPERYLVGAYSRRGTMKNILKHIGRTHGEHEQQRIIRMLQVTPVALGDVEAPININFAVDVMAALAKRGVGPEYFRELGANSIRATAHLPFAATLAKCGTIPNLYKCYLEQEVRNLEKNTTYRYISAGPNSFFVEAVQNDDVAEALKNKNYGSAQICEFKTGGLTMMPLYVGMAPIQAKKIKCIHKGDPTCRWIVQFDTPEIKRLSSAVAQQSRGLQQ